MQHGLQLFQSGLKPILSMYLLSKRQQWKKTDPSFQSTLVIKKCYILSFFARYKFQSIFVYKQNLLTSFSQACSQSTYIKFKEKKKSRNYFLFHLMSPKSQGPHFWLKKYHCDYTPFTNIEIVGKVTQHLYTNRC